MHNILQTRKTNSNLRSEIETAWNFINTNKFGLNLLSYFASKEWNIIPLEIKNSGSFEIFKTKFQNLEPEDWKWLPL